MFCLLIVRQTYSNLLHMIFILFSLCALFIYHALYVNVYIYMSQL
jgi:hypothetical protein